MESQVMLLFYWFLKFFIFFGAIFISNPVYDQTGWWGIAVLILLVLWGENYFDNKLSHLKLHYISDRLPILKELERGDLVTLELKNGSIFSNFIFNTFDEYDVTISRKIDLEQILEGKNNIRYIKIRKIKVIKKLID